VNRDGDVGAAGGFLVQLLSGGSEQTIARVEANVAALAPVTTLVRDGYGPAEVLQAEGPSIELAGPLGIDNGEDRGDTGIA